MSGEELYHIIEQYLGGNLDAEEQTAFEKRLADDPQLAREVNLHRKIHEELGNAPKRNLRAKLDQLRQEFTEEEKNKVISINRKRQWRIALSIAAGFLLLSFFIWFFLIRNVDRNEIVEDPTKTQEEVIPQEDPVLEDDPTEIVEDQKPKETIEKDDPPKKDPIQMPKQDALASLEPNPDFENLIAQNGSQNVFEFNLEKPKPGQTFQLKDRKIAFQVSGLLLTSSPEEENLFTVAVFDNKSKTISKDKAIQSFSLPLEKSEDEAIAFAGKDEYFFDLKKSLTLAPGLYYFTLSQDSAASVLFAGKFLVAENK